MALDARRQRALLRARYGDLYVRASAVLFRLDPIGINFESNTDEYEPEVDRILPGLLTARSVAEVRDLVHGVFVAMFDPESAGPEWRYQQIAEELWALRPSPAGGGHG